MKTIYCIMITGKDDVRIKYAMQSVDNFLQQSYNSKKIIIFNHNTLSVYQNKHPDIMEIKFDMNINNLGDARNMALNMVPMNALWTTWDDDDFRDENYLALLEKNMNNNIAVAFKNRIDYCKQTKFKHIASLDSGFVTLLCKKDPRISYLSKFTMEDLNIIKDIKRHGNVHVIDNDPTIYIRLIHENNTSLYANRLKTEIKNYSGIYKEYDIKDQDIIDKVDFILENKFIVY
jgi:hypothetical protein